MDPLIVTGSPERLARWFVADLESAVRAAPAGRPFTLAVPGGSVGDAFFPSLAAADLPWSSIHVFWTDERAVPPSDPQSNYAQAVRLWLAPAGVPPAGIHRMPAERADIQRAAEEHARVLTALAGFPPALDHVLLGVGEDGHVASLFPGLAEGMDDAVVAWTARAPKPPPRRMTLGFRTLVGARRVVIAALGAAKRSAVADALSNPGAHTPLARLLRAADRPVLLDATDFRRPAPAR